MFLLGSDAHEQRRAAESRQRRLQEFREHGVAIRDVRALLRQSVDDVTERQKAGVDVRGFVESNTSRLRLLHALAAGHIDDRQQTALLDELDLPRPLGDGGGVESRDAVHLELKHAMRTGRVLVHHRLRVHESFLPSAETLKEIFRRGAPDPRALGELPAASVRGSALRGFQRGVRQRARRRPPMVRPVARLREQVHRGLVVNLDHRDLNLVDVPPIRGDARE